MDCGTGFAARRGMDCLYAAVATMGRVWEMREDEAGRLRSVDRGGRAQSRTLLRHARNVQSSARRDIKSLVVIDYIYDS